MSGSKNYKNYREDINKKLLGIPEFSVKGKYFCEKCGCVVSISVRSVDV